MLSSSKLYFNADKCFNTNEQMVRYSNIYLYILVPNAAHPEGGNRCTFCTLIAPMRGVSKGHALQDILVFFDTG